MKPLLFSIETQLRNSLIIFVALLENWTEPHDLMEEMMIEPITASQVIDDEYIEIDIEIYRVERLQCEDYVVLKINEEATYMSTEDALNIATLLQDVANRGIC
jgi:hypothetical protein